jgi:hypothetical protein
MNRVVPYEWADMTKLIVAFCNFENALKQIPVWPAGTPITTVLQEMHHSSNPSRTSLKMMNLTGLIHRQQAANFCPYHASNSPWLPAPCHTGIQRYTWFVVDNTATYRQW